MKDQSNNSIKRIATYGRVSTGRQEKEKTIETQLSAVQQYADDHNYEIVAIYKDEGWSGTILARPSLDQLRTDARKKLFDAVLIYDPDRLSRIYWMQAMIIDELGDLGIESLFVTVPPTKNDEDGLMQLIRGGFAQYERAKITERFRIGKIRKAKEGNIVASEAPYGYNLVVRRGKRGDHDFSETHYEINESEARIVRMIFRWIADECLTLRKVVKRLHEMKIPPRKSKRGVWNTSTLSSLVRNKSYIGEGHYGASYAVIPENPLKKDVYKKVRKSSRKIRSAEEWILVKVPAIFENDADKAMFTRAQEQLKLNFAMSQRNKKNQYLVAGKIRCKCGCTRTGEGPQHGKYRYYRCSARVNSYPLSSACAQKGINTSIADEAIWSELCHLMTSPDLLLKQIQAYAERRRDNTKQGPMLETEGMQKEILRLKAQENRYEKAYGEGDLSIEKFRQHVGPIRQRIVDFEKQVAEARTTVVITDNLKPPTPEDMQAFAAMHAETLQGLSFEEKRAIVRDAIDSVIGTQGESGGQLYVNGSIAIKNYVKLFTSNRDSRITECRQVNAV